MSDQVVEQSKTIKLPAADKPVYRTWGAVQFAAVILFIAGVLIFGPKLNLSW